METRICASTGLALVSSPVLALRTAKTSYGPLDPIVRQDGEGRERWSRYDTVGRTVYAADSRLTAYMELLAPYRTEIAEKRRALQPVANFLGKPLDELWNQVVAEWDEAGNMKATWLPRAFREGRGLYSVRFPDGWWVDVGSIETICALNEVFEDGFPTASGERIEHLTLSHLTSDDRVLTTAIASALRDELELDDGSLPLGIRFTSSHGHPSGQSGGCWAYWMRATDSGLTEPATVDFETAIGVDDGDLRAAMAHCKIKMR